MKCFMRRSAYDSAPNTARNNLPIIRGAVNELKIITTNQFVPKKNKTAQPETAGGGPPEAGRSPSEMKIKKTPAVRRSSTRKGAGAPKKSVTAGKTKVSMPPETGQGGQPPDEAIRIRAYFISERRRRFGLPGDADSDWLEATRQLLSETGRR
jgi:hypothetical protein